VGSAKRQVIGVLGAPGAWTNHIGWGCVHWGAQVLWPEQSLHIDGHQSLYDSNCENPEVMGIHNSILAECGENRYSGRLPRFFDVPFPGPEQFLSKFSLDKPVCIVDSFMCLVWNIWLSHVTDVVVVNVEEEATRHFLTRCVDGNMTELECRTIFEVYTAQLQKVENFFTSSHNHFHHISNKDVIDGCGVELARSVIGA